MFRPKYSRVPKGSPSSREPVSDYVDTAEALVASHQTDVCDKTASATTASIAASPANGSGTSTRTNCLKSERVAVRASIKVEPRNAVNESTVSKEFIASFKELQSILPSTSHSRVSDQHDQCIASKIRPAGVRCTRSLGRSCDTRARLENLIQRLEVVEDSFLASFEEFLKSAMCGRSHKPGACKVLQELRDRELVTAEVNMLRVWLQGLFNVDRKPKQMLDSDSPPSPKVSSEPNTIKTPPVKKPPAPQACSSKPAASNHPPLSGTSQKASAHVRLQKRKASTLVPQVEPKRIHDHGARRENTPGAFFVDMPPIVISPTGTTYDSPSEDDEIFDEKLEGDSRSQGETFIVTPLTPPTSKNTVKTEVATSESPLQRKSIFSATQVKKGHILAEDDYFAHKIFRNNTLRMEQITNTTLKAGENPYSLEVDTHFRIRRALNFHPAKSDAKDPSSSQSIPAPSHKAKIEREHDWGSASISITQTISGCIVSRTPAEKVLEHIIPFEVQKRLGEDETTCAASLQDECLTRCSNAAKKFSKRKPAIELDKFGETPSKALKALLKYDDDENLGAFLEHVENFTNQALCGSHATPARKRIHVLEAWLRGSENADSRRTSRSLRLDSKTFAAWVKAITSPYQQLEDQAQKELAAGESPKSHKERPVHHVKIIPNPIPRLFKFRGEHFQPWQPGTTQKLSVHQALRQAAMKPLNKTEVEKHGCIYVFWIPGVFGLVKIGLTKDPKKRLQQWDRQCKRVHEYHGACYDMITTPMRHVFRVERLMHTELKDVRFTNACQCKKTHREWFMDTEAHVFNAFVKWRDWIEKEPYALDSTGTWRLKPEFEQSLDEVCKPLEDHKAEALPKKKRRPTKQRQSATRRQS